MITLSYTSVIKRALVYNLSRANGFDVQEYEFRLATHPFSDVY